jgi:hypothetical protein
MTLHDRTRRPGPLGRCLLLCSLALVPRPGASQTPNGQAPTGATSPQESDPKTATRGAAARGPTFLDTITVSATLNPAIAKRDTGHGVRP